MLHDQAPFKREKFYGILRNSMILFAPFIAMSRYFLNYNSDEQIYTGLIVGFVCAFVWFRVVMRALKKNGELYKAEVLKMSKKFQLQDNFVNPQALEDRYD